MSSGGDKDASVNGDAQERDPFELGNHLAERGEMERAEEAYRRADDDGHGTAAAYAGLFAEARGEFDEARDAYRRADERGDGFGALRLGLLAAARGDTAVAVAHLQDALHACAGAPALQARARADLAAIT